MNQGKDDAAEAAALQAVERHHAHTLKHLNGLAALLMEAVEARDAAAEGTAQATLLDWCDTHLIPMPSPKRALCTVDRTPHPREGSWWRGCLPSTA